MIKNIRNALLTKYLEINFNDNKSENAREFASWDHIIIAFEIDVYGRKERTINHITNEHIYEDEIRRMSVKHAAQVFGGRFGDFVYDLSVKGGKPIWFYEISEQFFGAILQENFVITTFIKIVTAESQNSKKKSN